MKLFLTLGILTWGCSGWSDSFSLGVGGVYSQIYLPSTTSQSTSVYRGPGYVLDGRLRFSPPFETSNLSFDIFAELGQNFTRNISASDTHNQDSFMGGIDVFLNNFFIGMQYGGARSTITTSSNTTTSFSYEQVGVRGGYRIGGGGDISVTLCGLYQSGFALPNSSNGLSTYQRVYQFGAMLLFQVKVIGDEQAL